VPLDVHEDHKVYMLDSIDIKTSRICMPPLQRTGNYLVNHKNG